MTISAKIIADSIHAGKRIITYELEYPRFIHAEFMTHRLFSRNAASSRAIPVARAIELIETNTARPIHWGKNQPGMSAKEECTARYIVKGDDGKTLIDWGREKIWDMARDAAIGFAKIFDALGFHKQIVNRLLEPYSHIKVVCTATEYENFFYLRRHPDAQPEIQELAEQMWLARERSKSATLGVGDWHVPYYGDGYWLDAIDQVPLEDAIAISASCAAQVSYRKTDDTLEKAKMIYARLVESKPVHASPFEHQATPMREAYFREDDQVLLYCNDDNGDDTDTRGITHFDKRGYAWSGNFKGWVQNRQLIDGHDAS